MMKTKCGSVPGLAIMEWWKVDDDQDWFYDLPDVESFIFFSEFSLLMGDKEKKKAKTVRFVASLYK